MKTTEKTGAMKKNGETGKTGAAGKTGKKIFAFLAAALAVAASAQAQAGGPNAISGDAVPLIKGLIYIDGDSETGFFALSAVYERLIFPHYTVGGRLDLAFGSSGGRGASYFGLSAHGRWYPLSETLEKLYFDVGFGFNAAGVNDAGDLASLTLSLHAGYKHFFTNMIFVEPSVGYGYSKVHNYVPFSPMGWQAGLGVGASF
ncbi:MAG: hypothetical protein LBD13_07615 [Spirochaetaceae bacterium]|jgi:hypothetical protein|nr:hypothetical protein [Spirochaetaceae bacterium]